LVLSWPVIAIITSAICSSLVLRYEKSAVHYAGTQSSFEEIALKFLQVWQIEALKMFLKKVSGSDEWSLEFTVFLLFYIPQSLHYEFSVEEMYCR
jgi:hypothetical protein